MVTIKTKKEMNLPELIEWGFKNDIREKSFIAYECVGDQRHEVHFNALGIPKFSAFIKKSNTFTVITEEEITEDTVIPEMLVIFSDGVTDLTNNKRLNDLSGTNLKSAYIMNDDLRLILIWRDGRMVEQMVTIKHTRESIAELEQEREQFKQ